MHARDTYRTPSEVVNDFLHVAPVDLNGMAGALGLSVVQDRSLPNEISGRIERVGTDGFRITVNGRHPLNRRRFTLAHEIGHYVLHRDLIGDGITDDALYRSALNDDFERQANRFAADVLMPARLVREAFRAGIRSFVALAKHFLVSADAARIRMQEMRLGG